MEVVVEEVDSKFEIINSTPKVTFWNEADYKRCEEEFDPRLTSQSPLSVFTSSQLERKSSNKEIRSNYNSRFQEKYQRESGVSELKILNRNESDKENAFMAHSQNSEVLQESYKLNSTIVINGVCTETNKNSFISKLSNFEDEKHKRTSKVIASPGSYINPLYNNSSKDTINNIPDSYSHPNHGEPMDLGSQSNVTEDLKPEMTFEVIYQI